MQLMPGTAAQHGVTNPFDPEQNIRGGVAYLKTLMDRFDGNTELARRPTTPGPARSRIQPQDPPYRETQAYAEDRLGHRGETRADEANLKIVELIDGREVPRYSDKSPKAPTRS